MLLKNMPKSAIIIDLNSCSNNCLFCCPEVRPHKVPYKEIEKDVEVKMLRQAIDLARKGLGDFVEISGSDPVQYKKISNFIRYLKRRLKFKNVMLATHGRDLKDMNLVSELKKSGLGFLRIPLYGSTAEIHDSVTQQKGSFKETVTGLKNLLKAAPKIKIEITSLVMKQNYRDLVNIFDFASGYSGRIKFSVPFIHNFKYASKFAVSYGRMKSRVIELFSHAKKTKKELIIADVPFCVFGFFAKEIINITGPPATSSAYSIPDKYKSNKPNLPSYRVKIKPAQCRNCSLSYLCGGFYKPYIDYFGAPNFKPLKIGLKELREKLR